MDKNIIQGVIDDIIDNVSEPQPGPSRPRPPEYEHNVKNEQPTQQQQQNDEPTSGPSSIVDIIPSALEPIILPPSYSSIIQHLQQPPSITTRPLSLDNLLIVQNASNLRSYGPVNNNMFFTRVPPPSYAEVFRTATTLESHSSEQFVEFGPEPIFIWCPRCRTNVITQTHSERSKLTHCTALILCVFGCWPCCLVPYCLNSCKNIYHYCPICHNFFGLYRPW